jgi:hypothetical protein
MWRFSGLKLIPEFSKSKYASSRFAQRKALGFIQANLGSFSKKIIDFIEVFGKFLNLQNLSMQFFKMMNSAFSVKISAV